MRDPLARLNLSVFLLSMTIYSPVLVLFYTGRGLTLFQVLSLEALNSAVIMLAEAPAGVLGDRIGLKRTVFLGHFLQAVWLVVLMFSHDYWMFLAGYAFLGLAISLRSGSTEAWVYELLKRRGEERHMTRAQGSLWASQLAGRITSALLAVAVVRAMSDSWFVLALGLSAGSFVISSLIALTISGVPVSAEARQRGSLGLVRDGLNLIRRNRSFRRIVLASVFTDPFPYALLFLYQPYFQASDTPLALYGIAAAAGAGVGALSAKWVHVLEARVGAASAFRIVALTPLLMYLAMAVTFHAFAAALLYVLCFGLMQARYPLIASMRNIHISSHNRATAISLISMLEGGWALIWKLIVGRLADVGLSYAFVLLATLPFVGLIVFRVSRGDIIPERSLEP
ncbi:MAG TPA: MFS transporter [Thermomicrobiales bacterium]|nr:MFS transporter [Thermomicrobiales bacterium]